MTKIHVVMISIPSFWDKVQKDENVFLTRTQIGMDINPAELKGEINAFFIKLQDGIKIIEQAWKGYIYDIQSYNQERYRFKIKLTDEIPISKISKRWTKERFGWCLYDSAIGDLSESGDTVDHSQTDENHLELFPPFFNILRNTVQWSEFEKHAYTLFRIIGIHTVYRWKSRGQSGRADGFFKFKNLAIIYDCTLDSKNFEENKRDQIVNYCNQLKGGQISLDDSTIEEFHNHQKQVWIITRGRDRFIKRINDVAVKEVTIFTLIEIYQQRLLHDISEEELENKFRNISSRNIEIL